ncbi:hypothetical protein FOT62_23510 [Serratia marcescens]|uniref:Uncharacterized protein n=1 Tax=Serratia marcescens TaxID=615 RepID=A0A5C7BS39_SERMA|nr:hypothetical protein [Serratia marcescens]TXE26197.1 hypothetical protein FOT62_23510 [Serratia marcescens]TXE54388.1 hypothetical protein FOT56_26100 [Serratia marcescens]
MTYIFLIIVVSSQSMSMQVQPMQDMAQCKAAIKAIDIASEKSTWSENIPQINNIKCVEVKP